MLSTVKLALFAFFSAKKTDAKNNNNKVFLGGPAKKIRRLRRQNAFWEGGVSGKFCGETLKIKITKYFVKYRPSRIPRQLTCQTEEESNHSFNVDTRFGVWTKWFPSPTTRCSKASATAGRGRSIPCPPTPIASSFYLFIYFYEKTTFFFYKKHKTLARGKTFTFFFIPFFVRKNRGFRTKCIFFHRKRVFSLFFLIKDVVSDSSRSRCFCHSLPHTHPAQAISSPAKMTYHLDPCFFESRAIKGQKACVVYRR